MTLELPDKTIPRDHSLPFRPDLQMLKGIRVLVVEDADDTRVLFTTILARSGADVEAARSAEEAIDIIRQNPPHVLLSDIGMPGQDGYALLRQVRELEKELGRHLPAAAVTAFATREDKRRALLAGFELHVVKPASGMELVSTVLALAKERTYH